MTISIENIGKHFGDSLALDDVSVSIADGELLALLGPSGCGKTTLLRVLAGLEQAQSGRILFDGDDATRINARHRNVGFVFQSYALFRHMSVFDNVAFGLTVRPRRTRPERAEISRRVRELLELIQLDWAAARFPDQLSGGQRQRVALARALAVDPAVLLLDEPFGALDAKVRKELRRWLRELHDQLRLTTVFVTHDQDEALELADRVLIMDRGRVQQAGRPDELYDRPASPFVYDFLGDSIVFPGRFHGGRLELGGVSLPVEGDVPDGTPATAYVRAHEIEWSSDGDGIEARVEAVQSIGAWTRIRLLRTHDGESMEIVRPREQINGHALEIGQRVAIRPTRARVFGDAHSRGALNGTESPVPERLHAELVPGAGASAAR